MKVFKYFIVFLIPFFSSCATAPLKPTQEVALPTTQVITPNVFPVLRQDIIHIIGPGETLWRISKMYDVKIEDIMTANKLKDATMIKMGQELLVPNAAPLRPVVPVYQSDKWQYIIIHHSATDEGSAFSFNNMHLNRGFWNGLGYHFVIDNGTFGKADGQIEIAPRWIKQEYGAHCKASEMNYKGIGICLVGNFSKENVSEKQMQSLVYLVNILTKYYKILKSNILGHGQVPDAATECPGSKFPWEEFWFKLDSSS